MTTPVSNPPRPVSPAAWPPLARLANAARRPVQRFFRIEAASGILLLAVAFVALLWANSPWESSYLALWSTPMGIRVGGFEFERSLEWAINDGLMVIFFFVVGLEIRREISQGELSEWRRAALPAVAALGGMIAPASLYLWVAGAAESHDGWGVPMATDIAFAVGVLALLGKRVPAALRVLLLALAVIDDVGAIVVIAMFYSAGVSFGPLLIALAGFASVFVLRAFGVRNKLAYAGPGLVVWAGVYGSGVHPTIAGVLIGLITPVRPWPSTNGLVEASPAESLIQKLHPWVAYGIMPIFALANAGVRIDGVRLEGPALHVVLGVTLGLVVGKPLGVLAASALALRTGIASLPAGIGYRQLLVLGVVAGVGFTMALFLAQLAFSDVGLLAAAKLGVLAASGIAACATLAFGGVLLRSHPADGAALTEDEAECSTAK
ncbi:MAG TPA: Na+/H+ antiporter NhaA [Polyangiales bacterium]|nr:Na+/H+ antiporter NhaA [Polyangiales bacterium]